MKIDIDQLPLGLIILNEKHQVEKINQPVVDLLGFQLEDYQEKGLAILSDDFVQRIKKELQQKNQSFEIVIFTRTKDEKNKSFKCNVNMKKPQSIMISIIDITLLKNEEIKFFNSQRIDNLQNITKFISLEYNNHLAAILGFVSFIKNLVNPTSEILQYLNVIETSAIRASSLTNQLLTFSGTDFFKQTYINLNKTISHNVEIFQNTFSARIKFDIKLHAKELLIYWDENQINQIIINTILNAKEAIEQSGKEGTIYIKTDVNEKYIIYIIEDDGIGIDVDKINEIFKPYYTTKNIKTNSGLGLCAVDGIIKNIGGTITADVVKNRTRFTISFPNSDINIHKYDSNDKMGNNENILVIDDREAIRNLVYILLTNKNFKPITVKNHIEAFEVLEKDDVDLILLDLMLPGMPGEELFYQIKKKYPKIPIVLLTGSTDKNVINDLIEKEGAGIIVKPFKNYQFYNEIFSNLP
ncbi:MAG: response regulator [Spirochaetes bacterium]|nr:response regulator [Spirochaetota bacterium]